MTERLFNTAATPAPTTHVCQWCGGNVSDRDGACPYSVDCPRCGARPSHPCKRPSGHRAANTHAARILAARVADQAEPECICHTGPPDEFGNRDHIVNPDCPACA